MKRTVESEQFFTPKNTVQKCLSAVNELYPLEDFDLIVEPSAGAGAFYELLPGNTRYGLDIAPLHSEVIRQDFLTWSPPKQFTHILTIGNPPYGQRAALAVKFLEKACTYSSVVAFVLPRSFKKYTFQNRVPLDFHLISEFDCEDFADPSGHPLKVKSVFQVWERRDVLRDIIETPASHPDFTMEHAHLSRVTPEKLSELQTQFEFAIPQVGANFAPRHPKTLSKGSYWFIKPNSPGVREIFELLDFSFLDDMNTAHKSLSKRDIIQAYVNALAD